MLAPCSHDVTCAASLKSPLPTRDFRSVCTWVLLRGDRVSQGDEESTRGRTTGDARQPSASKPPTASPGDNPNGFISARRPGEDNLHSWMLQQTARRLRLSPRHRDRIRPEDGAGPRSPRSPPPRPVSLPGEPRPFDATELPRLHGSPSPHMSANEDPPSSAQSSPQECAGEEALAAPPAGGGAGGLLLVVPTTFIIPVSQFGSEGCLI
ncbi:hypothetical protein Efla_002881 [Eimeria flavescens]